MDTKSTQWMDWVLRYGSLLKVRKSKREKQLFLQALVADIHSLREDIKVAAYRDKGQKEDHYNVYVGRVKTARLVIATYYDTPAVSFGPYHVVNRDLNAKNTLRRLLVESVITVSVGFLLLFLVKDFLHFSNPDWKTWGTVIGIVLFFLLNNHIIKGRPVRQTLVRNTSSILTLLELLKESKIHSTVAYAFLDDGCTNQAGLEELKKQTNADILLLDSVGGDGKLYLIGSHVVGEDRISAIQSDRVNHVTYLASGMAEDGDVFVPSDRTDLSTENIEIVLEYIQKRGG